MRVQYMNSICITEIQTVFLIIWKCKVELNGENSFNFKVFLFL